MHGFPAAQEAGAGRHVAPSFEPERGDMATLTRAILTYSYVDRAPIDFGTVNQDDPDIALLVQVNSLMSSAAAAFSARRYDEAINDYHAAESLICSQLDPQWAPSSAPASGRSFPATGRCSSRCCRRRRNG